MFTQLIRDLTPILSFDPKETHFPVPAHKLVKDSVVSGHTLRAEDSVLEVAGFDDQAPTYVKYHNHGDQGVVIQYMWLWYLSGTRKSMWHDVSVHARDNKAIAVQLHGHWYPVTDMDSQDSHPVVYVTRAHRMIHKKNVYLLAGGIHASRGGGHKLLSPPVLLDNNDYAIKVPHNWPGEHHYIGQGIEGDTRLLKITDWSGNKIPSIPSLEDTSPEPSSLDMDFTHILLLMFVICLAFAAAAAKSIYVRRINQHVYDRASQIVDSLDRN